MSPCNEWLEYEGMKAPVHYICGYLPTTVGADVLSQKLLSFKSGHYPSMKFWLNIAFHDLHKLLAKDESDLVTRALSHDELKVDLNKDYRTPLGYVCARTTRFLNSRYAGGMIYKLHSTQPLKGLSKNERWEAIKDKFKVADGFNRRRFKQFWFVDDVITTGATARAVWKALLEFYPDIDFRVFALARTVHDQEFNKTSTIIEHWNEIKDIPDRVLYEPEELYLPCSPLLSDLPMVSFDNSDTFFVC